jgi:hypothetical protein
LLAPAFCGGFSLYLRRSITNAMNDNDFELILNSSKADLVRLVKRWKSVSPETTTFSAIILEEMGEWDSIAESIDDFCTELNSNWESTKTTFFETNEVPDFQDLKHKIENNLLSSKNPIQEAGESLNEVASSISILLWASIISAIVVVVFTLISNMGQKGLLVIQIIYGLIALITITGIIRALKKAGNRLENYNR